MYSTTAMAHAPSLAQQLRYQQPLQYQQQSSRPQTTPAGEYKDHYQQAQHHEQQPPNNNNAALPPQPQNPQAPPPSSKPKKIEPVVGPYIEDRNKNRPLKRYKTGPCLGKGGFAHCYELTSCDTGRVYAGKIIAKASITSENTRKKLANEIRIHRAIQHKHIVKFERYFEDTDNVILLLECCPNQTLMELVKRRGHLTETEAQCFMWQILNAVHVLHQHNVIHRDLKLGNLLLDRNMNIKIGDFGLAARLDHPSERKKTICGTPNYIAPEILDKRHSELGHSFEVDIWAIGVIAYTLLYGRPPFETNNIKSTYERIRTNTYTFKDTPYVSEQGKNFISIILNSDPDKRPSLEQLRSHPFFSQSPFPRSLPLSCLQEPLNFVHHMAPGADPSAPTPFDPQPIEEFPAVTPLTLTTTKPTTQATTSSTSAASAPAPTAAPAAVLAPSSVPSQPTQVASSSPENVPETQTGNHGYKAAPTDPYSAGQAQGDPENVEPQRTATASASYGFVSKNGAAVPVSTTTYNAVGSPSRKVLQAKSSGHSEFNTKAYEDRVTQVIKQEFNQIALQHKQKITSEADPERPGNHQSAHEERPTTAPALTLTKTPSPPVLAPAAVYAPSNPTVTSITPYAFTEEAAAARAAAPELWVTLWVDYTSKYGLGYLLNNGSCGMYFNDMTKIILHPNLEDVQYISRKHLPNQPPNVVPELVVENFKLSSYPPEMTKKMTLLQFFQKYLTNHKASKGSSSRTADGAQVSGNGAISTDIVTKPVPEEALVHVKKWLRTDHAILFRLSNRTIQVIFADNTEILLNTERRVIAYTDKSRLKLAYSLDSGYVQERHDLQKRLRYAKDVIAIMLNRSGSGTEAQYTASPPEADPKPHPHHGHGYVPSSSAATTGSSYK